MSRRKRNKGRPLDPIYQDAEDSFAAAMAIIERATMKTGGNASTAKVLRWYKEHHADERPVSAKAKEIGDSYWVELSERTVQYAHTHWKKFRVLTFQPRVGDNNSNLPPWASLDWRAVVRLASIDSVGTVQEQSTRVRVTESHQGRTGPDGSFFLPGDGATEPAPPWCSVHQGDGALHQGDGALHQGDGASCTIPSAQTFTTESAPPYIDRTCAGTLARARADVLIPDDDDVISTARGKKERIQNLALSTARKFFLKKLPPGAWPTFCAAAWLAVELFCEEWLDRSVATVKFANDHGQIKVGLLNLLVGTLRDNCDEMELVTDSPEEGWRKWFGKLMFRAEQATRCGYPPPPEPTSGEAPAKSVQTPAREPTFEERAAAEERLTASRAEKLRRIRRGRGDAEEAS